MDWWLRGRIIYTYSLWVVFKAAAVGGIFDSMVGEMVVEAGKNVTLNCPGVTENSLILMLEWRVNSMQLLEYSSNTTIVWNHQNRVSLSLKNYALQFHPVTAQDTGEYTCLVNSRSMAEAVISLIVHGYPLSLHEVGDAMEKANRGTNRAECETVEEEEEEKKKGRG
ncbi:uncharacterized protein LOC122537123 [Frieseomelitta varia]|uniref:uncharacterized protein LOC122537123 n=1 Tax=Frieseomelitta varia TaxID=561572 RepID=UPI001CB6A039|nr:uncharacterized protein LOC122537123 [Frieseomelitta varia]